MDDVANARAALRMILEALEAYGGVTNVASEEAVIKRRGPNPTDEAAELVEAIKRLGANQSFLRPLSRPLSRTS